MMRHLSTGSHRFLAVAAAVAATMTAHVAHAQYYGGVVLTRAAQAPSATGFNGGEKPAEFASLNPMTRGINLTGEPSLGMKLGFRVNPYVSLEARYVDKPALTSDAALRLDASARAREKSLGLDLVGSTTFFKKLSVDGRAGFRSESFTAGAIDLYSSSVAAAAVGTRTVNSGLVGVGLQYNFNQSLGLRFEVERQRRFFSDRNSQDADNVMLGVHWRF